MAAYRLTDDLRAGRKFEGALLTRFMGQRKADTMGTMPRTHICAAISRVPNLELNQMCHFAFEQRSLSCRSRGRKSGFLRTADAQVNNLSDEPVPQLP
ncbi:hypothetical protein TcasGA2_TC008079 [Tribolium castaneum]|uniref:Uncharacterized protein n=1 Tax=Tribolium castaneum TaxID=7070 RepID=D1ZZP9_TRICA|nr:hypothetical protein TcasGA2_TC008079 [Tribolium castaneum]